MVRRILVATDFSEDADRGLTVAIDFGNRLKATVDLVHVYRLPMPTPLSIAGAVEPALPAPDELLNAHRQLAERADRVRKAGIDCVETALGGDAATEIVFRRGKSRRHGRDREARPPAVFAGYSYAASPIASSERSARPSW